MRRFALAPALAAATAALLAAAPARAGKFAGFSEDRRTYLTGTDQVCTPLAVTDPDIAEAATCERGETRAIAADKYRKGERQAAASGYRAQGRGTRIHLFAPNQDDPVVRWNAGGVVSRVTGVYAVDDGAVVAVEFESRRFGRLETDAVAFRLRDDPKAGAADDRPAEDVRERAATARDAADALAKRRKWKAAEQAYRDVLKLDPTDVAARYGLAVALARRNKRNEAVRELRTLSKSTDDRAIVWLVEARTDSAFRRLRKNKEFRRAVGLDRDEGQPLTAYERLLDPTGWERPTVACEAAGIAMTLRRKDHSFRIRITNDCQGYEETLRLSGSWRTQGASYLILTFPNVEGPDETTRCEIRTCDDGSGEDCLSCQLDADLGFTLRPVRR